MKYSKSLFTVTVDYQSADDQSARSKSPIESHEPAEETIHDVHELDRQGNFYKYASVLMH